MVLIWQPTQPLEPTEPLQPTQPLQLTQPLQPTEPLEPTQPLPPTRTAIEISGAWRTLLKGAGTLCCGARRNRECLRGVMALGAYRDILYSTPNKRGATPTMLEATSTMPRTAPTCVDQVSPSLP